MVPLYQFLLLLVQIFPAALKAAQAWEEYHGQRLNRQRRKQLASDINTAVQTAVATKNTAGLEETIKTLGRPLDAPAQSPQKPS